MVTSNTSLVGVTSYVLKAPNLNTLQNHAKQMSIKLTHYLLTPILYQPNLPLIKSNIANA